MNKLKDFTVDSEWVTAMGIKLKFHSIDPDLEIPLFTTDEPHEYDIDDRGFIGFMVMWIHFKKI